MPRSTLIATLLVGLVAGCDPMDVVRFEQWTANPWQFDPDFGYADDVDDEPESEAARFTTEADTPFVGKYTTVAGLNTITLEGVGLVTGLDGTGGNPPPSRYRTRLLEQMRKEGVTNPNEWLARPDTALVVVRADFPPLVRPGDRFDVKVRLPSGSDASSLKGGWLLETYLSEAAVVPGRGVLNGHVFAKAAGPVLVSTGEGDSAELAGVLRRGRVLGGGVSLKSRDMSLFLRSDFRSVRNARRIADRIGLRFHQHSRHGIRESLAEAKTDQKIELKIHDRYRDNFPRFLQVISRIPFRETDVGRRIRMELLEENLNDPPTSFDSALQLEAIGNEAVPILRTGLNNPSPEVRFQAAMALAYLDEAAAIPYLARAAQEEPAFRVYALAALAALDDGEAMLALRGLLGDESGELRYGAFRAMTVIDEFDPSVAGEPLPDPENPEFKLHVLDTGGDPMVHITHFQKAEIVVFGAEQRFHTPLVARAGKYILVKGEPGKDTVLVSRHDTNGSQRREVPNRVADVIRTAARFGASYPEIAQLLVQANRQGNLTGRFEIDALPKPGRTFIRPTDPLDDTKGSKTRIGRKTDAPNLFGTREEE